MDGRPVPFSVSRQSVAERLRLQSTGLPRGKQAETIRRRCAKVSIHTKLVQTRQKGKPPQLAEREKQKSTGDRHIQVGVSEQG